MQPPPRKGKVTTAIRNVHNEQLVKLQAKHQQDSDFLDDIRNFTKMRAVIEKEYAQSLLKLATSYLQKKAPIVPESKTDDGQSYKTVYGVWKSMLDENEKIAKARLAATEVYQQQVSEGAKSLRLFKLQVAKKCFDNMRKMHEEIQTCVVEIDKTKKLYFEEEHMAHDARDKAHDADEKLKRKKGRIFQSISSLQKNSAKFSFRREACDIQATKARNDYVLALIAANAHLLKYYEQDLPELVQFIDCDIYDKVREYILLISRTELLTCAACQSSFNVVQEQANMATQQYTMECFFKDNPVLSQATLYEFEPCDNDKINTLCIEHNAALCLSKEARRWVSCVTKEVRVVRESKEELKKLLSQVGEKTPFALISDTQGPQAEIEARIDELRQIIRRAQTSKRKAESRLEAMKEAGVNIDDWVRTSETESVSMSDSPADNLSRSGTVTSKTSHRSYQSEAFEESTETNDAFYDSDTAPEASNTSLDAANESAYLPEITSAVDVVAAVQEAWDAAAETEEFELEPEPEPVKQQSVDAVQEPQVNGEAPPVASVQKCVALFSYEATNSDELSFVEQEELEVINEGDGDGWVKARNYKGEEGFIPQNYVEIFEAPLSGTSTRPPLTSFSSVDYTMPNEDQGLIENIPKEEEIPVVNGTALPETQRPADLPCERISCCQALYDYEATCDEELTFFEGQIIKILKRVVYDVDDGWWEGEIEGKIGLFPSLVVEELKENGEPLTPMSPPDGSIPPPAFTPPEAELMILPQALVTLTRPTPENPGEGEEKVAEDVGNYNALESSPESTTGTVISNMKETEVAVNGTDDSMQLTSDECPTVVVTSITAGDTPTSDDEQEAAVETKQEEAPEAKKEETSEAKKEEASEAKKEETSEAKKEETSEAKKEEISETEKEVVPETKKEDIFDTTFKSGDEFECTFPDMDDKFECSFPEMDESIPSVSHFSDDFQPMKTQSVVEKTGDKNAGTDKMDVNGTSNSNKDFFGTSENFGSETTG